jgi:hypothetical protein
MKHKLQNVGSVLILAAYVGFLLAAKSSNLYIPLVTWLMCLLPVGIIELILMFKHNATITEYVRSLVGKKIDTVLMIGSIVLTWWLAGELAAGFFFIGFLVAHFGEKQE